MEFDHSRYGDLQYNVLCRICSEDIIAETTDGFCDTCKNSRFKHAVVWDGRHRYPFCYCWVHQSYVPKGLMFPKKRNNDWQRSCNFCGGKRPFIPSRAVLEEARAYPLPLAKTVYKKVSADRSGISRCYNRAWIT